MRWPCAEIAISKILNMLQIKSVWANEEIESNIFSHHHNDDDGASPLNENRTNQTLYIKTEFQSNVERERENGTRKEYACMCLESVPNVVSCEQYNTTLLSISNVKSLVTPKLRSCCTSIVRICECKKETNIREPNNAPKERRKKKIANRVYKIYLNIKWIRTKIKIAQKNVSETQIHTLRKLSNCLRDLEFLCHHGDYAPYICKATTTTIAFGV